MVNSGLPFQPAILETVGVLKPESPNAETAQVGAPFKAQVVFQVFSRAIIAHKYHNTEEGILRLENAFP